jgi:hypothetical protein
MQPAKQKLDSWAASKQNAAKVGEIEAALTRWTLGEWIYPEFLKELDPHTNGIWEVRVTAPGNHVRLVCSFACQDTLVIDDVYTRKHLQDYGSENWKNAINNAKYRWDQHFRGLKRLIALEEKAYVSAKCSGLGFSTQRQIGNDSKEK